MSHSPGRSRNETWLVLPITGLTTGHQHVNHGLTSQMMKLPQPLQQQPKSEPRAVSAKSCLRTFSQGPASPPAAPQSCSHQPSGSQSSTFHFQYSQQVYIKCGLGPMQRFRGTRGENSLSESSNYFLEFNIPTL